MVDHSNDNYSTRGYNPTSNIDEATSISGSSHQAWRNQQRSSEEHNVAMPRQGLRPQRPWWCGAGKLALQRQHHG